jgi:hypothetical protein
VDGTLAVAVAVKEAGVIAAERRGTQMVYRLVPAAAERLRSLAGELLGTAQIIPAATLRRPARPSAAARPS